MAHEEAFERWNPLDRAEAELASQAQRQQVVREQPVQPVGDADQSQGIEPQETALLGGVCGGLGS